MEEVKRVYLSSTLVFNLQRSWHILNIYYPTISLTRNCRFLVS